MKTSLFSSHVFCNALFTFILFSISHVIYAQCPIINNTNPNICLEGAGYSFKDLNSYVTDTGNGIVWYNQATGGTAYDPNELVFEGTYFVGDNTGNCGTRASLFVDFTVNGSGKLPDKLYCSKENASFQTYIDDVLQPFIPSGGAVEIYTDFELTNLISPDAIIPIGFTTYYTVFKDIGGCKSQIQRGQIGVSSTPPDPTPEAEQIFCTGSTPTVADLDPNVSSDFYWYESLDSNGNPINELLPTEPLVNGEMYYLQIDDVFCTSNPVSVLAVINTEQSGISSTLTFCENNLPVSSFNLFEELGDPKDATGTWSGPVSTSNGYLGLINISTLTAGTFVFSYTVPANGSCPDLISTVSIKIDEALTSGTPLSPNPITFCETSLPTAFDLFAQLTGHDAGGQWTAGTLSTDPAVLSPINMSGFAQGTYYYTYTQNLSPNVCNEESTTIQVDILSDPNAGTAINQNFCDNDLVNNSPFNLFTALDGTQSNNNGVWRDINHNTISNVIDITGFTFEGGPYNFSYTVGEGDCSDIETIAINIYESPNSGTANTPAEFCKWSSPSSFDLFSLLTNADQTGTWFVGLDDTGATTTNLIDISGFTEGTYNYTYAVTPIGLCADDPVTVQIIINTQPNSGIPSGANFCEHDKVANSPLDLFDQLFGEEPGGTWTDDSNTGALTGSEVGLTSLVVGFYNYTYTITDPKGCTSRSTVVVTIEDAPESGIPNGPVDFCEGTAPTSFDLFSLLTGADQGGTWYVGIDNLGAITTNPIDVSELTVGTYNYTYEVTPAGTCTDELVTVQVIINPLPNTGTPSGVSFCVNDLAANSPLDLFTQLSGPDSGGLWTDDSASGALISNEVDLTRLAVGFYNYSYVITDPSGCTNSSTVVVSVEDAPESGVVNGPVDFCEGTAPTSFDLFNLLTGADEAGTWYVGTDDSGSTITNPIDLSGLTQGTYNYTYEVTPIGTCTDELVTVQIIINPRPNTGTPSAASFCESDLVANSPFDLFDQLNGEDSGGLWTDDSASGALTGSEVDLTNLTIGFYNFTYTITDADGCTNSSTVVVTIEEGPESGTPNSPAEFCKSVLTIGQTFNLFDLLTGADLTGTWTDDDTTGTLSGSTVSLEGLPIGISNFTYNVDAIGSCDDVDVTVSIIINEVLPPAASALQEFCDAATVIELRASGTAINWYDASVGGNLLDSTTALIDEQIYYASQTDANTACESGLRTAVTVRVYQSPNAGTAVPLVACIDDSNVDLFNALDGTQDTGGTWENNDGVGTLTGNIFDTTNVPPGSYQFTYLVIGSSPCTDADITITVDVEAPLNAGTNNTLDVCSNNGTTDLFTLIEPADVGGVWSPALTSGTGVFDPLLDTQGTYTYVLSNSCGTFSSDVDVTVTQEPDAGIDNTLMICEGEDSLDLFDLLGSTAQTGGLWLPALASGTGVFDPAIDEAGTYSYTVTSSVPCSLEDIADITVTVNDTPALIVTDANPEYCLIDNPTIANLGTTISPTGTVNWYEDDALTLPLLSTDTLLDGESYFATQTNSTGCESSVAVQIDVTINDAPAPTLLDTSVDYCINDEPTINDLSLNITEYNASLENLIWFDSEIGGTAYDGSSILSASTYYVALINADSGCESSIRLSVTPDITACEKVEFPDGFSPNGDGINDTLDVDYLEVLYPNFTMEIYNRYGNVVYKGNANTPRFDGTANQSKAVSKGDLPVGVYFYIFNFNDGENPPEQGRIYLSR